MQQTTNISSTFSEYCTRYYGFGFNGKEKDDEIKGSNNSLDFGARIYDSRTGRWLSVDPLTNKFPNESSYLFTSNNPILFIDPDGRKKVTSTSFVDVKTGVSLTITITDERSLKSKMIQTSEKIFGFIPNHDYTNEYGWFDSEVKNTVYVQDGKFVGMSLGVEKIVGSPKTTTSVNWKSMAERKVYGAVKSKGWSGINWTSESGQSSESRVADENVRSESIDMLVDVVSNMGSMGPFDFSKFTDNLSFVSGSLQQGANINTAVNELKKMKNESKDNEPAYFSTKRVGSRIGYGIVKTTKKDSLKDAEKAKDGGNNEVR